MDPDQPPFLNARLPFAGKYSQPFLGTAAVASNAGEVGLAGLAPRLPGRSRCAVRGECQE